MTIDTTATEVVPARLQVSAGPVGGSRYALVRFEAPVGGRQLDLLQALARDRGIGAGGPG